MKEEIEYCKTRIKELKNNEQQVIQELGKLEKSVLDGKATLISIRGGIFELDKLLKALDDDGTDVSEQVAKIKDASDKLKGSEEE